MDGWYRLARSSPVVIQGYGWRALSNQTQGEVGRIWECSPAEDGSLMVNDSDCPTLGQLLLSFGKLVTC